MKKYQLAIELIFMVWVSSVITACAARASAVEVNNSVVSYKLPDKADLLIQPSRRLEFPRSRPFPIIGSITKFGMYPTSGSPIRHKAVVSIVGFRLSKDHSFSGMDVREWEELLVQEGVSIVGKRVEERKLVVGSANRQWLETTVFSDAVRRRIVSRGYTTQLTANTLINIHVNFEFETEDLLIAKGLIETKAVVDSIDISGR